jgi:two-component system, NarL family, sensor kinase
MLIRRVLIVLCLLLILFQSARSQQKILDSLKTQAHMHRDDTLGVLAFADLCYEYRLINQDSALLFGKAGVALGKRIGYKTGLAQVSSDVAFVYFDKGDFQSAIRHWNEALALRRELDDKPRVASLQMKLGGAYFRIGDYETSLKYQLEALRSYEELKMPQGVGQALNNAAAVYEHQNLLDDALATYQRAYDLHSRNNSKPEMGITLLNIGNIHFRRNDFENAKHRYTRALALIPDAMQPSSTAIGLNNLSEIHILQKDYDSARMYSQRALDLRKKIGDYAGVVSSLNMMGRIHSKKREFAAAQEYLNAALDSARRKNILPEEGKIHLNLSELFRDKGDWKNSLESFVAYTAVKDSLLNQVGRDRIAELQIRYETEKKEQQIALQNAELSEKQTQITLDIIIISGLVLTIALLAIIFALLRNRQRRKLEIERKENEISVREAYIRASIESQENERKRFAQDLHDGMGQWMSSLRVILGEINDSSSDEEKLVLLEKSDHILQEMNHEFRSIAFNLMPHTLIRMGLVAAIEEMVLRLNATTKVRFSAISFGFPERLSELEEITLYRVSQEWINNILKYANASQVTIQLTGHQDERILMIEDDGEGFNVKKLHESSGNGWKNIHSRLSLIKASVDIDTTAGRRGTTFTVTAPVGVFKAPAPGFPEAVGNQKTGN